MLMEPPCLRCTELISFRLVNSFRVLEAHVYSLLDPAPRIYQIFHTESLPDAGRCLPKIRKCLNDSIGPSDRSTPLPFEPYLSLHVRRVRKVVHHVDRTTLPIAKLHLVSLQ